MRHAFKVLISVFALAALGMSVAASGALAHPGHKHPVAFGIGAAPPDPRGFAGGLQPEGQVRRALRGQVQGQERQGADQLHARPGRAAARRVRFG